MCSLANYDTLSTAEPGPIMNRIKVLIVEDHPAVRQALAARLSSFPQIEVLATPESLPQALKQAQELKPDVVLLELKGSSSHWPDPVGEMNKALSGHPTGIIVLTSYADDDERESARASGARRYLLKQIDSARLISEIEAVATEISA